MNGKYFNEILQANGFSYFIKLQAEEVTKYASETLPNMLANLEKQVGEKGYFVADQLTYADIAFYCNSTWPNYLKVNSLT